MQPRAQRRVLVLLTRGARHALEVGRGGGGVPGGSYLSGRQAEQLWAATSSGAGGKGGYRRFVVGAWQGQCVRHRTWVSVLSYCVVIIQCDADGGMVRD